MYEFFVKINNKNKELHEFYKSLHANQNQYDKDFIYELRIYKDSLYLFNNVGTQFYIGNDITRLLNFFYKNPECFVKNISFLRKHIKYLNTVVLDSDDCERIHDYINTYVSRIKFNNKDKKISVIVTRQKDIYSYISKRVLMGYEVLYKDEFRYYLIAKDGTFFVLSEAELTLGCKVDTFLNNIYCDSIVIDNLNVSKITSLKGFFKECSFESVVWKNVDTSTITDFSWMFFMCKNLINLDIKSFNTSKGSNFSEMFAGCESLKEIDIKNFDTTKGVTFYGMFNGCYNIKTIDMLGCKTSAGIVTTYANMFNHCHRLENLLWNNFYKENCNIMDYSMFESCPLPKYYYINEKFN